MKIRNNVLVKVDDCDINSDGTFTFPEGVTSIGTSAFYNCTSLTKIKIPESVTAIGYAAFANCISLIDVYLPAGIISLSNFAFSNCVNIENFTIGNIDVLKVFQASKQTINNVHYSICSIADAASFVALNKSFIDDNEHVELLSCNYKNNVFSIEAKNQTAHKYAQDVLMPLVLKIQAQKETFNSSRNGSKIIAVNDCMRR